MSTIGKDEFAGNWLDGVAIAVARLHESGRQENADALIDGSSG
ncbi:MAG: hypothetical protein ACREUM_11410 [Nitrosospira sp.]